MLENKDNRLALSYIGLWITSEYPKKPLPLAVDSIFSLGLHIMRTTPLLWLLCLFVWLPVACMADVFPANEVVLHYRLIGFKLPEKQGISGYRLEVFENKTKILSKESKSPRVIATLPAFGKTYSWRVAYLQKGKISGYSAWYSFSIGKNPYSDTSLSRLRIITHATKYNDMMVFFDNTKTLYNMRGEVLWFLPIIQGITDSTVGQIRDIKLTKDGTITFITPKSGYEIDYQGNILWATPNDGRISGKKTEQFHHEFTKLTNGNYMIIGDKFIDQNPDGSIAAKQDTNKTATKSQATCGMIIEYNKAHDTVWTWASCYQMSTITLNTHFNAFWFDEKNKVIYTSYRNLAMLIKTAYPSGKVLARYGMGDIQYPDMRGGSGQFFAQHNCSINSEGSLMLFNNNYKMHLPAGEREKDCIPTVAIFKEPVNTTDTLEKIWEFSCAIDSQAVNMSQGGGSVRELDKGDYLVCTGHPGRNFIVSKDKKIIWHVISEVYDKGWKPSNVYRTSAVRKDELVNMLYR